jgi:hypothetical protein
LESLELTESHLPSRNLGHGRSKRLSYRTESGLQFKGLGFGILNRALRIRHQLERNLPFESPQGRLKTGDLPRMPLRTTAVALVISDDINTDALACFLALRVNPSEV